MRARLVLLGITILAALAAAPPAVAQKRLALVVGIDAYPRLPASMQLLKAVADAETMAETMTALGLDVEIGRNLDRIGFVTALDRLKRKIAPGDTVFIFYAGHGVALKGTNLLLPSDMPPIDPESDGVLRALAIAETDLIEATREKSAGLTILALDACRDNPIEAFAREQARIQGRPFRSVGMRSAGLETRPTSGVFSIYSAGIGQTALDRLGSDRNERNSVFTRVFAKKLREPGRHLTDLMEDVKEEVAKLAATHIDPHTKQPHRQFPAFYNETQGGRVFLAGLPPAAAPAVPIATDPVVARVNGTEIRQSDLALAEAALGNTLNPWSGDERRDTLVGLLVDMILVANSPEAGRLGETRLVQQAPSFNRNRLLMEQVLDEIGKAGASDEAMRKAYAEAIASFTPGEEVRARHILVETEREADALLAQIRRGRDFAVMAKEKSKDPGSAANGGDLGYFTKDQMVAEFSEAAFKLRPGQVSGTVKTQFGWHLIKLEDRRAKQAPEFEAVKDQLQTFVSGRAQAEFVTKLRESAKVERLDKPAAQAGK